MKKALDISVVLCTYNGEMYISELLDSLNNQTMRVNELLVGDDGSTDSTLEIIEKFAKKSNIHVRIIQNKVPKGAAKNFIDTTLLATGDIVFWCDQDDIWKKDKIHSMIDIMMENNNMDLLCTNLKPFYMSKPSISEKLIINKQYNNDKVVKVYQKSKNLSIQRSGCTMCFRKSYFISIYPYWIEGWYHDDFIWKFAVIDGTAFIYNHLGVLRRIHGQNASVSIKRTRKSRIELIQEEIKYCKILKNYCLEKEMLTSFRKTCINEYVKFQESRISALNNNKHILFFKLIIFFPHLYRGIAQLFMDGYMIFSKREEF